MSAFYIMRLQGVTGASLGAAYIGRGAIIGADDGDRRYNGTYTEADGRLRGNITLSLPNGGTLVTSRTEMPPGISFAVTFDWPTDFAVGTQQVSVEGRPASVTFEKVGDVP
jgi:hypothetical protein